MKDKKTTIAIGSIILIIFFIGIFQNNFTDNHHNMKEMDMDQMSMDEKHDHFISLKNSIQDDMRMQHKYRCCLEKPCASCLSLTPWHGEGAECDCLSDIVNGVHPCGECVGGILAGRGNPYLVEYFAEAIAEKVGEEHLSTLKKIIEEKY